jgi:hypothetical protein
MYSRQASYYYAYVSTKELPRVFSYSTPQESFETALVVQIKSTKPYRMTQQSIEELVQPSILLRLNHSRQ